MAHRKHLSQEGHAEPEKKQSKKTASEFNKPFGKTEQGNAKKQQEKTNYPNPHIKNEHGEY